MKEGRKTSEFWTSLLAPGAAAAYGLNMDEPFVQGMAILAVGIAMGCYALSRGLAKGAALNGEE